MEKSFCLVGRELVRLDGLVGEVRLGELLEVDVQFDLDDGLGVEGVSGRVHLLLDCRLLSHVELLDPLDEAIHTLGVDASQRLQEDEVGEVGEPNELRTLLPELRTLFVGHLQSEA